LEDPFSSGFVYDNVNIIPIQKQKRKDLPMNIIPISKQRRKDLPMNIIPIQK
jgi:hypothetical protein